jgi:hypothetical protein
VGTDHRIETLRRRCLAQQIVRRLNPGFGGGLPRASHLADANQPGPFVTVLEPADVGHDHGRPGLDPSVIGIHRGMRFTRLALRIIEIKADIRMQRALVALQRQRVVAALLNDLAGDSTVAIQRVDSLGELLSAAGAAGDDPEARRDGRAAAWYSNGRRSRRARSRQTISGTHPGAHLP